MIRPIMAVIVAALCAWPCAGNAAPNAKKAIVWEAGTTTVFQSGRQGIGAFYPRMIVLRNNDWLVAYDTNDGGGHQRCQVSRSGDNGQTWRVLSTASIGYGDAANAQILLLANGDLLLAYRLVSGDYKALKVSRSTDNGTTWEEWSTIAEVTMPDYKGVWEPHLGFLPDGKVAVMYASEAYQPDFPQVIEMKISEDNGLNWGKPIRVSDNERSRDGMPVWTLTNDGQVLVVFEATDDPNGIRPFLIRYKISPDGYDWSGERYILYAPVKNISRAAAPYVVTLPDGILMASAQVDYNPGGYDMHVLWSQDDGRSWVLQAPPFATRGDDMWNTLYPLADNRVVALTSTNDGGDFHIVCRVGREEQ